MQSTEKTKYKGVLLDTKTQTYMIRTTLTNATGFTKQICKRGFSTAKKAFDEKNRLQQEFSLTYGKEARKSELETEDVIYDYINSVRSKLTSSTIQNREYVLTSTVIPIIPNLKNVPTVKYQELYNSILDSDKNIRSKNNYINIIANFFEWCELYEKITLSDFHKIKRIFISLNVTEAPKSDYITQEEFKRFISTFENNDIYYLFFLILFYSGCRKGEALGLKYSDVDFENNTIYVQRQAKELINSKQVNQNEIISSFGSYKITNHTKTKQNKLITLPTVIIEKIKERITIDNVKNLDDFIFKNICSLATLNIKFKKHLLKADVKEIKIHDLRHSHTTMLYDAGCDGKYVAQRLGHASENTSKNIYNHLTNKKKKENEIKLEKIFNNI